MRSLVQVSPRLVGLALGQVLNLSGTMQWAVRQSAEAENNMTSIERLLEYTRLPQARAPCLSGYYQLAAWSTAMHQDTSQGYGQSDASK